MFLFLVYICIAFHTSNNIDFVHMCLPRQPIRRLLFAESSTRNCTAIPWTARADDKIALLVCFTGVLPFRPIPFRPMG